MARSQRVGELLRGVTVVSLEQAVAAPYCTAKLADQGARVIKVERPQGGDFARKYDEYAKGASSYFSWLNRGKQSLTLDIKQPGDRDLLLNMVAKGKVDVFVQNLAPGAAERSGFGSTALRQLNDRLITLDMSGYGQDGLKKTYKAYDLLVAAESGLCSVTGSPDAPGRVGVSICDIMCGQNGYAAILQGLLEREQTNKGSSYSVSLFDSVAEIMNVPFIQTKYTGKEPPRLGLQHPSIAPYGSYKTSDERSILISIQNEREWVVLCTDVLGNPGIATDERFRDGPTRVANRTKLDEIIQTEFSKATTEELSARLLAAGIAFGELNSVQGLVDHAQLTTVQYKTDLGDEISIAAPAICPRPERLGDVPSLGQHTHEIKEEFSKI